MKIGKVLGISHLVASCREVETPAKIFGQFGYTLSFHERQREVDKRKLSFLRHGCERQDMLYLESKSSPGLEFLSHNSPSTYSTSPYIPLFGESSQLVNVTNPTPSLGGGLPFYNAAAGGGVSTIFSATESLTASSQFWVALGFREGSAGKLEFNSIVPRWSAKLELLQRPMEMSYLDDLGWTCLSLLVQNVPELLSQLRSLSVTKQVGESFHFMVGGNNLLVVFLRGPSNELVELIEVT